MQSRLFALAIVFATALWASGARAHPAGVSQGEYLYRDGTLYAGITFARRDLPDLEGERLGAWLVERLVVSSGGAACLGSFDGARFDGDGMAFALAYRCPSIGAALDLDLRFVSEIGRGHRHVVALEWGDERLEGVARGTETRLSFEPRSAARGIFGPLFRMGIEHILTGYDHLLFLLGLVLVGGPARSLVGAITAFTAAHSITLAAASLGVWAPSARVIEPCIALSIAYVGIENWFVRDAKGRWRVTFPFGLVHGFGFAGALREVALSRAEVPTALMGFNLGVETGQLAVLAMLLPLVALARRWSGWQRVGMRACTATIALAGLVWFVVRVRHAV